jgi:quercetin 2,3-dioxygenase
MSVIVSEHRLDFVWHTFDPFIFCVHHQDAYPKGNAQLGPAMPLEGRDLGNDFSAKDGWSMYHGETVPGFPQHPHRGFETVTIARQGFIDHSDSLGARARFGHGDAQWLTAGRGIVHSEMFPLTQSDAVNPVELFQIWLNLPAAQKMSPPHFSMLWSAQIPHLQKDGAQLKTYAGQFPNLPPPPAPPPHSWAAKKENDLAIWTVRLEPNSTLTLPPAKIGTTRTIYLFKGEQMALNGEAIAVKNGYRVAPTVPIRLSTTKTPAELLVLQGKPIAEPVVNYGPFVMNSREEIRTAFAEYNQTQFGGWPFASPAPNHGKEARRFAVHANGKREEPT